MSENPTHMEQRFREIRIVAFKVKLVCLQMHPTATLGRLTQHEKAKLGHVLNLTYPGSKLFF